MVYSLREDAAKWPYFLIELVGNHKDATKKYYQLKTIGIDARITQLRAGARIPLEQHYAEQQTDDTKT